MKSFLALVALSLATACAMAAQPTKSSITPRHFGEPVYRQAVFWTQETSRDATGQFRLVPQAKIGPVGSSAIGFGPGVSMARQDGSVIATLAAIPVADGVSREVLVQAMADWYDTRSSGFAANVTTYLRRMGISHAYFSFSQAQSVPIVENGATRIKHMSIVWSGTVDNAGRLFAGKPRLVTADPTFVDVIYTPLDVAEDLPANWAYPDGGKLSWRMLNKKFEPVTPWTVVNVSGAFDVKLPNLPDSNAAVRCLVDRAYNPAGCPGATNVRKLVESRSADGAIVSYVNQLEPVYEDADDPATPDLEVRPVRAYAYNDRVWSCDKVTHTGVYGYKLNTTVDTYFVVPGDPRYGYSRIASRQVPTLSEPSPFEVSATLAQLGGRNPASVLVSPFPDGEIWNIPSEESAHATHIAPIRLEIADQLEAITPVSSDTFTSREMVGGLGTYTFGTVGQNYWDEDDGQVYHRTFTFNVDDPSKLTRIELIDVVYDDHFNLNLNGRNIFSGPENLHQRGRWSLGIAGWQMDFKQTGETCYTKVQGNETVCRPDLHVLSGSIGYHEPLTCTVEGRDFYDAPTTETVNNRGVIDANGFNGGLGLCPGYFDTRGGGKTQEMPADSGTVTKNIDLRQFIVAGTNTFSTTTVLEGRGEMSFRIRAGREGCTKPAGIEEGAPPAPVVTGSGQLRF